MRVALHTRVHPDRIAEYEAAHREVPTELTDAIRTGGATSWTIWRSGTDLFHVLDCADYGRLLAELEKLPVNVVVPPGERTRILDTTATRVYGL